jgi:two-component SAPR family response regulator
VVAVEVPVLLGFGGVAAVGASGPVELGGPKQRGVLALLLLEPGSVVPLDRMIDRIWDGAPPPRAEVSVRGYVSNLRKALVAAGLGSDTIVFRDRGYVLQVAPEMVDLHLFEQLVDGARSRVGRGDLVTARTLLVRAIDLFAGPRWGRWLTSSVSPT